MDPVRTERAPLPAAPAAAETTRFVRPHDAIDRAIRQSHRTLMRQQDADGAWRYAMEGSSVLPEAHFLIADSLFDLVPQSVTARVLGRILARQLPNGAWPLFPGHPGHLSTTVEAYVALRLSGQSAKSPPLRRARKYIAQNGGLRRLSTLTKVTLAVLGLIPWEQVPLLPVEVLLLPRKSPINLYSIVSFTRVHLVSILVLGETRYCVPGVALDLAREVDGVSQTEPWNALARKAVTKLGGYVDRARRALSPSSFRERALLAARAYLVSRQEPDGTWGNYILSTLWGVLAMQALGSPRDSAIVRRGLAGLCTLPWRRGRDFLVQPCNSTIWSTGILAYVLGETGVPADHPVLRRAARWLLDVQSFREGDWRTHCPHAPTGTWGFQEGNAWFPDVDDTLAAVRGIRCAQAYREGAAEGACVRGEAWAVAMQNSDGGWSSFDRNCRSWWLERLPFNDMVRAMTDPSTADMTGRVLEYLGVQGWRAGRPEVDSAVAWLRKAQEKDGCWFGRWGIAYVYGTWAALMGLGAVGVEANDPMARRAVAWLESVQNEDGGWGESCMADVTSSYVALGTSTASQTAWGLGGLLSVARRPTRAIERGIDWLLRAQRSDGTWAESYTTGAGFAGKLYLDYRFYKDAWPLQTLGLARNLYAHGGAWLTD